MQGPRPARKLRIRYGLDAQTLLGAGLRPAHTFAGPRRDPRNARRSARIEPKAFSDVQIDFKIENVPAGMGSFGKETRVIASAPEEHERKIRVARRPVAGEAGPWWSINHTKFSESPRTPEPPSVKSFRCQAS